MEIKIEDMLPTDDGRIRMYYSIDGEDMQSLILDRNDLSSEQTVENAVKDALKGFQYRGHKFNI